MTPIWSCNYICNIC